MSRLRLVQLQEPDPLPTGELLGREERRPGELHDIVTLDEQAAATVVGKARHAGVSSGIALTVLVELELLDADLRTLGTSLSEPPAAAAPALRLSAAEASYLRRLTFRRPLKRGAVTPNVAVVPVRLLTRMTPETLTRAADADLERAIRWEVAALTMGRTIGEFGMLLALRDASAG
jgi:hypothetical protein